MSGVKVKKALHTAELWSSHTGAVWLHSGIHMLQRVLPLVFRMFSRRIPHGNMVKNMSSWLRPLGFVLSLHIGDTWHVQGTSYWERGIGRSEALSRCKLHTYIYTLPLLSGHILQSCYFTVLKPAAGSYCQFLHHFFYMTLLVPNA